MPWRTSSRILSISAGVAFRSTVPITASRTEPWPTNVPKFGEIFVAATLCEERLIGQRRTAVRPVDDRRHALARVVVGRRHRR